MPWKNGYKKISVVGPRSIGNEEEGGMDMEREDQRKSGIKKWMLPLIAVIGVALLLAAKHWPQEGTAQQADRNPADATEDELAAYTEALTTEIESLCTRVAGAGRVSAAVSLQGGFTYLYATDSEQKTDGKGGEQSSENHITVGNGASESAVLLTRVPPPVRGIGIVCDGGDQSAVRTEIISLLSAAYGVGSNRIYVTAAEK